VSGEVEYIIKEWCCMVRFSETGKMLVFVVRHCCKRCPLHTDWCWRCCALQLATTSIGLTWQDVRTWPGSTYQRQSCIRMLVAL